MFSFIENKSYGIMNSVFKNYTLILAKASYNNVTVIADYKAFGGSGISVTHDIKSIDLRE